MTKGSGTSGSGGCSRLGEPPPPANVRPWPQVVSYAHGASEPVTHFNLDQLLDIVQSFRLDTTEALNPGRKVGYASVCSIISQGRILGVSRSRRDLLSPSRGVPQ